LCCWNSNQRCHALPPSADHPPLAAVQAPHRIGRGALLVGFRSIEGADASRDDAGRLVVDIKHSPPYGGDAAIDAEYAHGRLLRHRTSSIDMAR
jgi:hypothetical protein